MAGSEKPPEDKIIPFEEYAQRVTTGASPAPVPRAERFARAPYQVFRDATYLLRELKAIHPSRPNQFMLYLRQSKHDPSEVIEGRKLQGARPFAVTLNTAEENVLGEDLSRRPPEEAQRLRQPLARFNVARHLALHILFGNNEQAVPHDLIQSPVRIADTTMNLQNDQLRREEVGRWRVASGVGVVMVVGFNQPETQQEMRGYLANVLDWRHVYDLNADFVDKALGEKEELEPIVTDKLLGTCNPLEEEELSEVVARLTAPHLR